MLQSRSLLPLLGSSSSTWHLQALLRLPPELRQLAVQGRGYSSAALKSEGDDLDFTITQTIHNTQFDRYKDRQAARQTGSQDGTTGTGSNDHTDTEDIPTRSMPTQDPYTSQRQAEDATDAKIRRTATNIRADRRARREAARKAPSQATTGDSAKTTSTHSTDINSVRKTGLPGTRDRRRESYWYRATQRQRDKEQPRSPTGVVTKLSSLPLRNRGLARKFGAKGSEAILRENGNTIRSGSAPDQIRLNPRDGSWSNKTNLAHKHLNVSADEPFREEDDITSGFNESPMIQPNHTNETPSIPLPQGQSISIVGVTSDPRNGLQIHNDAKLHPFRKPAEMRRYTTIVEEYQSLPGDAEAMRTKFLMNLMGVNNIAKGRMHSWIRQGDMEKSILQEFRSSTATDMIVTSKGHVYSKSDRAARRDLSNDLMLLLKTQGKEGPQFANVKQKLQEIDLRAFTRGRLIREGTSASLGPQSSSTAGRLARLKETLARSPQDVVTAHAIQSQLRELELAVRGSAQHRLSAEEAKSLKEATLAALAEHSGPKSKTALDSHERPIPAMGDSESTTEEPSPKPAPAQNQQQDILVPPEQLAVFAELRSQMHELTSVLKTLVLQQAGGHNSPQSPSAVTQAIQGAEKALSQTSDLISPRLADEAVDQGDRETSLQKPTNEASEAVSSDINHPTPDAARGIDDFGSLYEQLFPEETAQNSKEATVAEIMPRVPLPREAKSNSSTQKQPVRSQEELYTSTKAMLILSNTSKTLTEDDFRRAMPRGKHLQEWTQRGSYERVIPVRNKWTLEKTGDYYILFAHSKAADAFLAHVRRLHDLSRNMSSSSLLSDLPALAADSNLMNTRVSNDAEQTSLAKNFTLLAPSMPFTLRRHLIKDHRDVTAKRILHGESAYQQMTPAGLNPDTPQVLLEFDGGVMPNWFQLHDAIIRDGSRRGSPWPLLQGDLAIRKLVMFSTSKKQRESEMADATEALEADEESGNELVEQDKMYDFDGAAELARERLRNGANGQRWVVAFKDGAEGREEAQRFARQWHMRGFPWTEAENRRDRVYRGVTRVKAEVLW